MGKTERRLEFAKICGIESYGTIRGCIPACRRATETGNRDGMTLKGVILLGQARDFKGSAGNDGDYLNPRPALAAAACYHGKVAAGCSPATQAEEARKVAADDQLFIVDCFDES